MPLLTCRRYQDLQAALPTLERATNDTALTGEQRLKALTALLSAKKEIALLESIETARLRLMN